MITTLRGLAVEVCGEAARDNDTNEKRIQRRLYKDTRCGISFWVAAGGVGLAGYAEGTDAECPPYFLRYPFGPTLFWETVEEADADGCALFDETHCSECGAEGVEGGRCADCEESAVEVSRG